MITFSSSNDGSDHVPKTSKSMWRDWLSFMIPMALLTWKHTSSLVPTAAAFVAAPLFAILQGTIGIIRYRVLYGDAPLPLSPAHGVVVVNPNDGTTSTTTTTTDTAIATSSCTNQQEHITLLGTAGHRQERRNTSTTRRISDAERHLLDNALKERPLRLLVIGDSLAIGVGTSRSCTPPMPEVIARTLSKALGGRAVYWTCHGAPGASAGWIVRELERGIGSSTRTSSSSSSASQLQQLSSPTGTNCDTTTDVSVTEETIVSEEDESSSSSESSSDEDELETLPIEWQEWKDRLHRHRKRFDPDVLGPYDVAVVISGSNDLKSAFFPFLLTGEDVQFRKQAKERGGCYSNELRLVLDVLRHRMEQGMEEIRDNILERLHSNSPRATRKKQPERATNGDGKEQAPSHDSHCSSNAPLIVLPGLPARALPIFRSYPLRWLAVPIVDRLDNHKRNFAKSRPDEVVFVEAPTVSGIVEYEEQKGPIWEQRETEETILALRDVHRTTCRRIQTNMMEYYSELVTPQDECPEETVEILHYSPPVPPMSMRLGPPGTRIFSRDGVHPNDEGYDFWGRHIGNAILKEWKKN